MKYYVYKRKAEWVEPPISTNSDMSDWLNWYRWKEWECLGYTEGAKELYLVLGKYIELVNSFLEQTTFKSLYTPSAQFLILDEKRRIRDYQELIRNIKTHRQYRKYCKSRWRWPENHSEQKRSITPEEVQEIRFKYNIDLKPIKNKRKINGYDLEYQTKLQRNWKRYRKTQYKKCFYNRYDFGGIEETNNIPGTTGTLYEKDKSIA